MLYVVMIVLGCWGDLLDTPTRAVVIMTAVALDKNKSAQQLSSLHESHSQ